MRKTFKITLSIFLLSVIVFASIPKSYIHTFLGHNHTIELKKVTEETISQKDEASDCDFEKFDTPVYYTIFKFILNFIPVKEHKKTSFNYNSIIPSFSRTEVIALRGPPIG